MKHAGHLPQRWRTDEAATRHAASIADVLDTPPIVPRRDGLVLFSMIGTVEVLPYLVALKSLWHQLRRGRVVILDDGSLTAEDRTILAHHCGDPEILHAAQIQRGPFPTGGRWEPILTILDRRHSEYWIHLASATLTFGPISEVEAAIARNRSFMLLGGADPGDVPLPVAEISTERGWRYARGSDGLAGFSATGGGRSLASAFLAALRELADEESIEELADGGVASSFLVSNEPEPVLLPSERFLRYEGTQWPADAAFVEFPTPHRHEHDAYGTASRALLDTLHRAGD